MMTRSDCGEVVVLTGAAGCLGYHTLKLLISHDDKVREIRCLDLREPEKLMSKLIDDELKRFKKKNIQEESSGERKEVKGKSIKWIKGDVRDINTVEQTLFGAHCVIHCAAKVDIWIEKGEQDVNELESINIGGTETLLAASIRLGVQKFIHVSSFEVYAGLETIYYATESTLPDTKWFLFGASAWTKKEAENKVKQFSNNTLSSSSRPLGLGADKKAAANSSSLNAIVVRFPLIYGEFDRYFVSKIIELTKFFGGKLQRMDFIWIRHQPIYAGNAAWSLIKAKQRMDKDQSISGEEFHITDETSIGDPFDFVEPFLESKGMRVTKNSYPFIPIWILIWLFFSLKSLFTALDFYGLFTSKKDRLQETIERDKMKFKDADSDRSSLIELKPLRWYHYITPQTLGYMCISNFLNRTKASLRLDYEPLIDPETSKQNSLDWYKNHLAI